MNHIVLIGRLTRDPELKYTPNGKAVVTFDLAVDRNIKNANGEKETDFIRVVVWDKLAELCASYLSKGRQAAVEGRLQIRNYQAQDGQKKYVTEVVAGEVRFLDKADGTKPEQAPQIAQAPKTTQAPVEDISAGINLDDLPF